ncbi:MAG TPA: sugar transferase [Perlabentimonas sp.]|jgi:lipopolysaccharide/colanic/teichoic acid biosynthesis glycosyltransferase|nr:sugar transferase [Bacteroidales bacterium]MDD4672707.1 sugar transferase [Bacteroidales bacterium]MDY0347571.1 sugar transferase [Tenuifilaceae bacterium]HZJ74872.1 sugar transferase [Perlabentimonas sp.]
MVSDKDRNGGARPMLAVKYILDKMLALLLLILFLPFAILIILWIWFLLKENPFFTQMRVGKNGEDFRIIKFKTIPEKFPEKEFKMLCFFRQTHIDELPQLLNILAGSMSIVGPRPHVPEHVAQYEPWQYERLKVKPGITCTRQLKTPFKKQNFNQLIELDIEYVEDWSLWLDTKIFFKTISYVGRQLWYTLRVEKHKWY